MFLNQFYKFLIYIYIYILVYFPQFACKLLFLMFDIYVFLVTKEQILKKKLILFVAF